MSDANDTKLPGPPSGGISGKIYSLALLLGAVTGLVSVVAPLLSQCSLSPSTGQRPQSPPPSSIQQTVNVTIGGGAPSAAGTGATIQESQTPSNEQAGKSQVDRILVTKQKNDEVAGKADKRAPSATSILGTSQILNSQSPLSGEKIYIIRESNPIGEPTASFDGDTSTSFDFISKSDRPAIVVEFQKPRNLKHISYTNPRGKLLDHMIAGLILEARTTTGKSRLRIDFDTSLERQQIFDISLNDVESLTIEPAVEMFGRRYSMGDITFN